MKYLPARDCQDEWNKARGIPTSIIYVKFMTLNARKKLHDDGTDC